jgi:KipI family sensor histidine kinase inhibitor
VTISIRALGESAVLLDPAGSTFDHDYQERIWGLARALAGVPGMVETVPGMNNLLVIFDPLQLHPEAASVQVRDLWDQTISAKIRGRIIEIPVVYGGELGEDLVSWAKHCDLTIEEVVRLHSTSDYRVAAVGGMPGFPYLSGLDPRLAIGRRTNPRMAVRQGAVIVGGAQAAIMPTTAPSGWHIVGQADVKLFDLQAETPSLLQPGDIVRFTVARIEQ